MERLDLPITGICSFGKYPIGTDLNNLEADIAVLGVPYDLGVGFLSGARLGPRRIPEASTQYARGEAGFYDYEEEKQYLKAPLCIKDCGDTDVVEVAPQYDPTGNTVRLAALTMLEAMGQIGEQILKK